MGYTDGRNATIEFRGAEGRPARIVGLTKELVRLKIDVLLTAGGEVALRAAKEATGTIPIVMVAVDTDPVAGGYVASLAHPCGNMTGVVLQQIDLTAKRLELLKEVLPRATRVACSGTRPRQISSRRRRRRRARWVFSFNQSSCGIRRTTLKAHSER